ncbi:type II toxin-antitoxin system VapC family toxin [Anatilimnocola aggregata]|uniref:type II toxin-antitoxin system VapC family toxin n=1 Tax=Anatilimnocola aggregata TaxID=2528021 RepID=UPI00119DF65B
MQYLLDTNTCIAAMRNHPLVARRLLALNPGDCGISTITAYELFTGVEKCADPTQERRKVELFLQMVSLLPFDSIAAVEAARIRAALEKLGHTIGPYDLLLAGHALSLRLILATNNTGEFLRVRGLTVEDWQCPAP